MAYIIVKFVATAATMEPTAKNKEDRSTSYTRVSVREPFKYQRATYLLPTKDMAQTSNDRLEHCGGNEE